MKKILFLCFVLTFSFETVKSQTLGFTGHQPTTLIPYNASPYSFQPYMRQYADASQSSNKIYNNRAARLFVNFNFDTSGKNVYAVYTTNGSNPNKSNGSVVNCGFSTFSNPDRLWSCLIPASSSVTDATLNYVFYISDGSLAAGWGRIDGFGGNQFLTTWNENSVQPFQYTVLNDNATFPVDLIDFQTQKSNSSIFLTWTTASEINNDYFEVQRSHDAKNFFSIGQIKGKGTTQENIKYEFEDANPFKGDNYYRLKQVDIGGKSKYSKMIYAKTDHGSSPYLVYPNPITDYLNLNGRDDLENALVIDQNGRIFKHITKNQNKIYVGDLQSGTYFLKVSKPNGEIKTERFIKL